MFCLTISPKPQNIQFALTWDKEKQQILTAGEAATREKWVKRLINYQNSGRWIFCRSSKRDVLENRGGVCLCDEEQKQLILWWLCFRCKWLTHFRKTKHRSICVRFGHELNLTAASRHVKQKLSVSAHKSRRGWRLCASVQMKTLFFSSPLFIQPQTCFRPEHVKVSLMSHTRSIFLHSLDAVVAYIQLEPMGRYVQCVWSCICVCVCVRITAPTQHNSNMHTLIYPPTHTHTHTHTHTQLVRASVA